MIRQQVAFDPLSSMKKEAKSPASSSEVSGTESTSLAASFVFVESSAVPTPKKLSRHPTVIHTSDVEANMPPLFECEEKQALLRRLSIVYPSIPTGDNEELSLLVTNYRLVVFGSISTKCHAEMPLTSILDLKSKPIQSSGNLSRQSSAAVAGDTVSNSAVCIDVKTKDCRFFQFSILIESVSARTGFLKLLNSLIFEVRTKDFLPVLRISKLALPTYSFNLHGEVKRFNRPDLIVSDANSEYAICHTYPKQFIVPSTVSGETLAGSARFRDKGRIPIVSWAMPNFGSIIRSSQPRSSLLNRSSDDEEYLKQLQVMFIIDCRPMLNAYANIANGAGVESLGNYHQGIELWFASIQNIHHVRDAWEKMFAVSQQYSYGSDRSGWFAALETTGWFDLEASILKAASVLVEKVSKNINVLCRCSHGLDRTPQVVSLAMLAVDPFYRSFTGFITLIEKEWVAMGHRFHSRNCIGHAPTDEFSPIFTQWIDCVYQVVQGHPDEFEFKPALLIAVLFGMLSSRYATFLLDSEKDRTEHGILDGESLWTELELRRTEFSNRNFQPSGVITIDHRIANLKVFSPLWLSITRIKL